MLFRRIKKNFLSRNIEGGIERISEYRIHVGHGLFDLPTETKTDKRMRLTLGKTAKRWF